MSITILQVQKLLKTALNEAEERFVSKKHFDKRLEQIDKQFEQVKNRLDEGVETILDGFDEIQKANNAHFERLEKIVDNWPASSTIKDLMERVGRIERKLKMTEFV